jgi:integrase
LTLICNLYTKGQSAVRDLFSVKHDRGGNLPPLPAIFPDQMAPTSALAWMVSAKDVLGNAPATKHFEAPPLDDALALYQRIRDMEGTVYRTAEWTLSASRLREALDARFDEVDLEAASWTIPASRTKTGRDHVVPMSGAMLRVFEAQVAFRSSDYLFPGRFNTPLAT